MVKIMNVCFSTIPSLSLILSGAANAQTPPSPEEVLAEASRYTIKIQVQNEIALNQDEAGSASGTGFLIDRERGWLLTNAHVTTGIHRDLEAVENALALALNQVFNAPPFGLPM